MRSTRARSHSGKHKCSILQEQRRKNGNYKAILDKKRIKMKLDEKTKQYRNRIWKYNKKLYILIGYFKLASVS